MSKVVAFLTIVFFVGELLAGNCAAQTRRSASDSVNQGAITILTDGIDNRNSPTVGAIGELAERLSAVGKLRVLPIAGHGGDENIRDALHLRGIDFAVVNSDILGYLAQPGSPALATKKLTYVAKLTEQKVLLFARPGIDKIEDLQGKTVAVVREGGDGHRTAQTIFSLCGLKPRFVGLGANGQLKDALSGDWQAMLLLSDELPQVELSQRQAESVRLIAIPNTPALRGIYSDAAVTRQELGEFVKSDPIPTLALFTILAVFDWTPAHRRYPNAVGFIEAFYRAVPGLRRDFPQSIWRHTDVTADVPGWRRFAPADRLRKVAATDPGGDPVQPRLIALRPEAAATEAAEKAPLRVVALARPPFADPKDSNGGLIVELLSASLKHGFEQRGATDHAQSISWTTEDERQLAGIITDKSADVAAPLISAHCDQAGDLSPAGAIACDRTLLSAPLFGVVVGLLIDPKTGPKFAPSDDVTGRTICAPDGADTHELDRGGRNWLSSRKVTVVRRSTLLECVSALQHHEIHAVLVNEIEASLVLHRVGLSQSLRMADEPLASREVYAFVAKDHPKAAEIVSAINDGLEIIKKNGEYSDIVHRRLEHYFAMHNVSSESLSPRP